MKQLETIIEPCFRAETSGKQVIPVLDEEDGDQDQKPRDDNPSDTAERKLNGILIRVRQEGTEKHGSGQDKKEIHRKISALEEGNNVVEMP